MRIYKNNLNKVFNSLIPYKIFNIVSGLLMISSRVYMIYLMQRIVDGVVRKNYNIFNSYKYEYIIGLAVLTISIFVDEYSMNLLKARGEYIFKTYAFSRFIKKVDGYDYQTGKVLSNIMNDGVKIASRYSTRESLFICMGLNIIVPLYLLFTYNVMIAVIVVAIMVICLLIHNFICKFMSIKMNEYQGNLATVNQFMLQVFGGLKSIKQLDKEDYFSDKYDDLVEEKQYKVFRSYAKGMSGYITMFGFMNFVVPIIVFAIGIDLIYKQQITVGMLMGMYALISPMLDPIRAIANGISEFKVAKTLERNMGDILYYEQISFPVTKLEKFRSMKIKNEFFEYGDKRFLENLDMDISKNDIVLIKGTSGSGKTTLINLISRFINIIHGKIMYNEHDINEIDLKTYYKRVLQAEQNQTIIEGTVLENILLGDIIDKTLLEDVVYACMLDEFIQENGQEYVISENGSNISGGQRQRIAIARMLVRLPEVIILDEPTSALNRELAAEMACRLVKFIRKNEMTMLVITHNADFDSYKTKELVL